MEWNWEAEPRLSSRESNYFFLPWCHSPWTREKCSVNNYTNANFYLGLTKLGSPLICIYKLCNESSQVYKVHIFYSFYRRGNWGSKRNNGLCKEAITASFYSIILRWFIGKMIVLVISCFNLASYIISICFCLSEIMSSLARQFWLRVFFPQNCSYYIGLVYITWKLEWCRWICFWWGSLTCLVSVFWPLSGYLSSLPL